MSPVDDEKWKPLDPVQKRLRTLDACKRLILREAPGAAAGARVRGPALDRQRDARPCWTRLVESLPTAQHLLLVNFRPEYQPRWGSKTYYTQLRIDPLTGESAEELLRTLLGADPSVQPLAHLLIERTEGNPLYLEESVRALVETGSAARQPRRLSACGTARPHPGAGHRAGDSRRAYRPAGPGRQASAAGCRRDRQGRALHAAAGDRRATRGGAAPASGDAAGRRSSCTRRAYSPISNTPSSTR